MSNSNARQLQEARNKQLNHTQIKQGLVHQTEHNNSLLVNYHIPYPVTWQLTNMMAYHIDYHMCNIFAEFGLSDKLVSANIL